jgi:hypothetical protein
MPNEDMYGRTFIRLFRRGHVLLNRVIPVIGASGNRDIGRSEKQEKHHKNRVVR